jgi:hypothetical protein
VIDIAEIHLGTNGQLMAGHVRRVASSDVGRWSGRESRLAKSSGIRPSDSIKANPEPGGVGRPLRVGGLDARYSQAPGGVEVAAAA